MLPGTQSEPCRRILLASPAPAGCQQSGHSCVQRADLSASSCHKILALCIFKLSSLCVWDPSSEDTSRRIRAHLNPVSPGLMLVISAMNHMNFWATKNPQQGHRHRETGNWDLISWVGTQYHQTKQKDRGDYTRRLSVRQPGSGSKRITFRTQRWDWRSVSKSESCALNTIREGGGKQGSAKYLFFFFYHHCFLH